MPSTPTTFIALPNLEGEHICSEVVTTPSPFKTIRLHYISTDQWEKSWELAEVTLRGDIAGRFRIAGRCEASRDEPKETELWLYLDKV